MNTLTLLMIMEMKLQMYNKTKGVDMNLNDLLKVKKVRCVKERGEFITIGKEYDVLDRRVEIKIIYDEGYSFWFDSDHFEPVLDSAENPLRNIELTPELEVSEPKFEVGDKVYRYGETDVKTVLEVFENGYMRISNYPYRVNHEVLCYATPENHAMLSKPYPHIEFEKPPKEITGSDLTKWLLERGDFAVVCKCSNIGEYSAIASSPLRLITEYNKGRFLDNTGRLWGYAVPCDPKTGVPLTEGVLNETI